MAERYATNQFYNLDSFEPFSSTLSQNSAATDNPPFLYPSNNLRNAVAGKSTPIQRGYIRMMSELLGNEYETLSRRRLHFQFNPDSITRSVAARNDIQLWMNMDPAQMTQPVPGDANFAFELLFNREAEVYSGTYASGTATNVGTPFISANGQTAISSNIPAILPTNGDSTLGQYSVTDIGVLADLIVFDELIGQGLNSQLIEAMVKRAETGAAYRDAQAKKDTTSDDEDKTPETPTVSFSRTETESALQANWGNSAFLIAQPIRVVLSSLFIVEGYVTSTTVMFNKFTPTMVPVQATVGIQMQAMYMGFGKKDTFFTKAFASNEKNIEDRVSSSRTETDALGTLGSDLFKKIENPSSAEFIVRPQDFFDKDKGSKDFTVRFLATNSLRDEISNKGSITKVTVTANIEIKYKGNSGTPPAGVTYDIGETIFSKSASYDLDISQLNNTKRDPWDSAKFKIEQSQEVANETLDKSNGSKYQFITTYTAVLVGTEGGTVDCLQVIKIDKEVSWSTNISMGSDATVHSEYYDGANNPARAGGL